MSSSKSCADDGEDDTRGANDHEAPVSRIPEPSKAVARSLYSLQAPLSERFGLLRNKFGPPASLDRARGTTSI